MKENDTQQLNNDPSSARSVDSADTVAAHQVDKDAEKEIPAKKGFLAGFLPAKKEKKPKEPAVAFIRLFRFASPLDFALIIIGCICSISVGALFPVSIIILGTFLNSFATLSFLGSIEISAISPLILDFVYIAIAMFVAGYLCQMIWVLTGENQTRRIRQLYVRSILRQDLGWFDVADEGSLTTRLAQDTQLIQDGISEKAGQGLQYSAQFVAGFVVAFVKGWKLALVLLASLPILGIVGSIMFMLITKYVASGQDAYADAGAVAEQVIAGIRTVYAFSLQDRFQKRYEQNLMTAYKADVRKGQVIGMGFGGFMFVMFCTYGLAFWYGSTLVINGTMTGGDVLITFFSMLMGAMSLIQLPPIVAAIGNARGAAYKIYKTIDRVPPIDTLATTGLKPEKVVGKIEFKDVSFHYPSRPDVPILKNLSLGIEPGMTVAFVGPSGSGKSTTVSLVQRLYDAIEGGIYLDGNNLKDLNVKWLRQNIGIVSQEPSLFNMTIKQNVMMGATHDVTENDIIEACKKANCHNFISKLPKGYDTNVGEHGGMISGGQKQRISIARALIKDPQILLLDEATSALDTASERLVQKALDAASKNRTTIVIAHRLSTIRNADLIVVLDKGEIVEIGKHDELVERHGVYEQLVLKQKIKLEENGDKLNGKSADEVMFGENMNDEELEKALAEETVGFVHEVVDEKTKEVKETVIMLDDNEALRNDIKEKRRLEKLDHKTKSQQTTPLFRVLNLMKPEWPLLALGCLGSAVAGCIFPAFAYIFATVITTLNSPDKSTISPGPFQGANLYAFIFVVLGVAALFSFTTQVYFFERAGASLTRRLRAMIFKAMMRQEIGYYDEEGNSLGALTSRLATDAAAVNEMISKVWGDVIQMIVTGIAGFVIAFTNSWRLSLVIIAMVPFIAAATAYESRIQKGFEDKTKKSYEESGEIAGEAFKEIRTVVSLAKEDYFERKFEANIERPHKLAQRKAYLASMGYGAHQGFNMFANAVGFYAGVVFFNEGLITFQHMFVVIMVIMITATTLGRTSTFVSRFAKAKFAAINSFEMLDRATEIDPDIPGEELQDVKGNFSFQNIAFAYPERPDQPVFTGEFNLEGNSRQTIALVGASGCGKSTTIGLIERWYDIKSGAITLDGHNIKNLQVKTGLRKHMALVGQEPVLFDMTIRENILWGTERHDVTDAELDEVAKMSNIFKFIDELPDRYETRVGDKGGQLSGGQKQRVAIARALIRKPTLLLLDEATSALDSESEKLVQEALDNALEGRTTITIAHRLSTIQNADLIAVVKDGHIVELGTHFELIALNGVYTDLVKQQDLNALQ